MSNVECRVVVMIMLTNDKFNKAVYFKHSEICTDTDCSNVLVKLQQNGIFLDHRAVLYKNNEIVHFKTALWIELENENELPMPFSGFKGLWLVELNNHKVFLHGSQKQFFPKNIGGRVIHDIEILNKHADWVSVLAHHHASSIIRKAGVCFAQPHKVAESLLYKIEKKLLENSIQSFIGELNPKALDILKAEGEGDNSIYNHYVSPSPEQHRNRIQAAKSYPWFSQSFRQNWQLRRSVDQTEPVLTELAKIYKIQPRTIKHFQGVIHYDVPPASKILFTQLVDNYSAEYLPKTPEDQKVFLALAKGLVDLANILQVDPVQLAKPFKNGWKDGLDKLEIYLDTKLDINSVNEMMLVSFYYGVLPLLKNNKQLISLNQPPITWFSEWFSQYGLKHLLWMANKWRLIHDDLCIYLFIKKYQLRDLQWPALLPITYFYDLYQIIELTSQCDLKSEGKRLEHCVASYIMKCLMSGSYITT